MPKKRVPGHLNRRRRRRDGGPNLPRETQLEGVPEQAPSEPPAYAASVPAASAAYPPAAPAGGRPLRPTLRRGVVGPTGRAPAPPTVEIDYRYVVHDLRQIGVLAAAGFVILIVLSFVVR